MNPGMPPNGKTGGHLDIASMRLWYMEKGAEGLCQFIQRYD
jgi:hypothetical protein